MKNRTLALAIAAVIYQTGAMAQTTATQLEEVIVTAERRAVSLQDVPASGLVLTGETLAKQGVDNIIEIQQVAPSVAINTYNRGTFINIRGVGIAQSAPTSVPGVATYIDGVYIAHETFIAHSFYDIASVEVLRGPQGTLTGQNSTGGAIYMRTPEPDVNEFSGYVEASGGDYSYYRGAGAVNIPMGGIFGLRLSGVYDHRGSFSDNIGPSPSEPGSSELMGARAALRIQPLDALTFDLRYEYFDLESDYNAVKNRFDFVNTDPFTIDENAISFLNQNGYRASVEGSWDITSGIRLRAITSKMDADNEDQADGDRRSARLSPNPPQFSTGPARVGYTEQSFDTRVTELNLLSTGDSKVQWVVGGFYMTETTPVYVARDTTSNAGNPITFVTPLASSRIIAEAENESVSGFGQIDIRFTDAFELDIGARYSEDTQDYMRFVVPLPPPPAPPPATCPSFPCLGTAESDETTGRVAAKFYAEGDTMFYMSLARGYKAGGVNLHPDLDVFGPETNTVGELGLKTTLADGRLRFNGSFFYSNYKDIQISALVNVTPTTRVPSTVNGPRAKIFGTELEWLGQFGGLGFNFGVSLLNGETTRQQVMTNSSVSPSVDTLVPAGTELPFTPEVSMSGGIEYAFNVGAGQLTPRLQANYMSKQWATFFQDPVLTKVPSRTVVDFRLTYEPMDSLSLEGYVTNLLDKTYIAVQVQEASSASGGYIYGAPRQFGGRVVYKF